MKVDFLIGVGGAIAGLIGVGYAIGSKKKLNDICKKVDKSIDELSRDIDIDISDRIIDEAVNNAVDRETNKQVCKATKRVISDVEDNMRKLVKTAVSDKY